MICSPRNFDTKQRSCQHVSALQLLSKHAESSKPVDDALSAQLFSLLAGHVPEASWTTARSAVAHHKGWQHMTAASCVRLPQSDAWRPVV